jgi:exopolysaccharide biosynthesis polyprenyl glycosylphosphotransferase
LASNELINVDPGIVLYRPDAAHEVAVPFVDARAAGRARAWAILRQLLQLDHKLWRNTLLRRLLAFSDAVAVLVAIGLLTVVGHNSNTTYWLIASVPAWLVLAKTYGLYDRDHRSLRHLTIDEVPALLVWVLTAALATTALARMSVGGADSIADAFALWLLACGTTFVGRSLTRAIWRRATPPERTLVIGSGRLAAATRRKIELFSEIHLSVVGERRDCSVQELQSTPPWLEGIDRVILAAQAIDEQLIAHLVEICRREKIKFSVIPPVRGMFGTAVQLSHVAELPVVEYNTWDISRSTMLLKRLIDVVVAATALIAVVPLLLVIALAIVIDSRGPVLFVQLRSGQDGKPFRMLKFRTMLWNAEELLGELVFVERLADPMFKLANDPRVTRIGRILRKTSLDELPQLLNVLRGDMSLVGPRPEQVDLVGRYEPEHKFRLAVKPGLTGPMQVFGRGELSFEERLAVERDYIENLSLGRDFRILALTFSAVATGKGAF